MTKVPYCQALGTQVVPDAEVPLAFLQDVLDRPFSQALLGDWFVFNAAFLRVFMIADIDGITFGAFVLTTTIEPYVDTNTFLEPYLDVHVFWVLVCNPDVRDRADLFLSFIFGVSVNPLRLAKLGVDLSEVVFLGVLFSDAFG